MGLSTVNALRIMSDCQGRFANQTRHKTKQFTVESVNVKQARYRTKKLQLLSYGRATMSAGNGMVYIWYSGYWETGIVRYLVGFACRQLYMYGSDMHLEYSHNCRNDFVYQTKMRSEQFIIEFLAANETRHKTPKNETGEFVESKHFQQNTTWHMTSWLAVAVYMCVNLCISGQKMRFQHGHKCQSKPASLSFTKQGTQPKKIQLRPFLQDKPRTTPTQSCNCAVLDRNTMSV